MVPAARSCGDAAARSGKRLNEGSAARACAVRNAELMIFPAAEQSGTATITIAVRDAGGAVTNSEFELTVTPLLRAQFSGWFRGTVLPRELTSNPVGEPVEEGQPLPQVEDINRIRIEDDTARNPAAYDDLIPTEEPEEA